MPELPFIKNSFQKNLAIIAAAIGPLLLIFWVAKRMGEMHSLDSFLAASNHLDVIWYTKIAEFGYHVPGDTAGVGIAFFPLFPLLIAAVKWTTGVSFLLSAHLAQKIALMATVFLSFHWIKNQVKETDRPLAQFAFFCHPAAIFLLVPYTESLFLALLLCHLILWEKQEADKKPLHLVFLAVVSFLLSLTRPTGLFLLPACALFSLHKSYKEGGLHVSPSMVSTVIGSLLALGTLALLSFQTTGHPLAFYTKRGLGWQEQPGLHNLLQLFNFTFGIHLIRLMVTFLGLGGVVLLFRERRHWQGWLCLVFIAFPVYQGKYGDIIRFTLPAFPAWIALFHTSRNRPLTLAALSFFSGGVAVTLAWLWMQKLWVG